MDKISVIVPCFNEEDVLPLFYKEVTLSLIHIYLLISVGLSTFPIKVDRSFSLETNYSDLMTCLP